MMQSKKSRTENQSYAWLQIAISVVAIMLAVSHMLWPSIKVDSITIVLLVICILPWLAPLIKSLELPGGYKIEFQEVQNAKQKADKAGLLGADSKSGEPESVYLQIADRDPNLALAGLRIEIEKRLIQIAQVNDLPAQQLSVRRMLKSLTEYQVMTTQESDALMEIVGILNSAVHGATVDQNTFEVAMNMGASILNSLDEKISNKETE